MRGNLRPLSASAFAAVALLAIAPAAQAAGLTKPEKKAVDIVSADGVATDSVAFARISFKGDLAGRLGTGGLAKAKVAIELTEASGSSTVITDARRGAKPRRTRTGSEGGFAIARHGRELYVLVEALPGPAEQLKITTTVPGPKRQAGPVDLLLAAFGAHDPCPRLTERIERIDDNLDVAESKLRKAEKKLRKAKKQGDEDAIKTSEAEVAVAEKEYDDLQALRDRLQVAIMDCFAGVSGDGGGGDGGGTPKCSDGIDNDMDGETDEADEDCMSGPGGTHDPNDIDESGGDESGDAFQIPGPPAPGCPTPGGGKTVFIDDPSIGDVVRHHLLVNGVRLIDSTSQASSIGFAPGAANNPCPDSNVTINWSSSQGPPIALDPNADVVTYEIQILAPAAGGGQNPTFRPIQNDRPGTPSLGLLP